MAITPLPTPPSRNDPANFSTRADAFLGALPAFGTEANALAVDVNDDAVAAAASASTASAAANAAVATANATRWISGTTYAIGNVAWSTINALSYRRITNGAGTTDPSADPTNWTQIVGTGDVSQTGTQTLSNKTLQTPNITSGLTLTGAAGTAGQVLTSAGAGAAPTWSTPSTGPTVTAVASGSLSDGSTVIVNADGTVSVVAAVTQAFGTPAVFENANTNNIASTYDPNTQRVVIAYRDNGNSQFGTVVIGSISGTSISFGTPVVFQSSISLPTSLVYEANAQRVVIVYRLGNNGFGAAIVGAVSGTSISFGSSVTFLASDAGTPSATYDTNSKCVVIAYTNSSNSNFGTAIVGTVSGTSISFGTPFVFQSGSTDFISVTYHQQQQRIVYCFRNASNGVGQVRQGNVSGTTLVSFGSDGLLDSNISNTQAIYDSFSQSVIAIYRNVNNSSFGTAKTVQINGTNITFGPAVVFNSGFTQVMSLTYNTNQQCVVVAFKNEANSNFGTAIVAFVSGGNISFGSPVVFNNAESNSIATTYDQNTQRVVIAYGNAGNSTFGTAIVLRNAGTNVTPENFIGFSNAAYTNGQTATIQIVGAVDDAQSGLTPGQSYFVQNNGTLGLTAATPSVFAGTAVASNKIIVKG